ncbi:hypothetical protein HU200_029405 [Digitaria exilis]|uniref:Uncharacterized protein n=1 Tax=Digitaria exilis TaxID=1010633 RepID=A0A835ES60_9POAL|nr:hypothetical protein HU200_029405 [Digitaria exilis]CAB3489526.1 unnamed protein product [Digitaria exilis]
MTGRAHRRICGGQIAAGLGAGRFHEGREQGGGGSRQKLGVRGGRIEGHRGQIEGEGGWIVVRGRRIRRAGLRINSKGEVFVPDSEDEDAMEDGVFVPDSEEEDAMEDEALEGAAGMEVAADGARDMEVAAEGARGVEVAADGDPGVELPTTEAPTMDGTPDMELPPEVQARLKKVLAGMDPLYHNVFISLYKVMVPAFFKCN